MRLGHVMYHVLMVGIAFLAAALALLQNPASAPIEPKLSTVALAVQGMT